MPKPRRERARTEEERCRAKNKSGERCALRAQNATPVCDFHGALGGRPPLHGRYSRTLTKTLRKAYEESLSDQGLTDVDDTLAAIDAVTKELLAICETGDTLDFRRMVLANIDEALARYADEDDELGMVDLVLDLRKKVTAGVEDRKRLHEIQALVERFLDRQEQVIKAKAAQEQTVTIRELKLIMLAIVDMAEQQLGSSARAFVESLESKFNLTI